MLDQLIHRVDGLWDSRAAAALSRWARMMEKSYLTYIQDPEEVWDKIRGRYIMFDDGHNRATVGAPCMRDNQWVLHEEVVSW